jgi:hypothetical protein
MATIRIAVVSAVLIFPLSAGAQTTQYQPYITGVEFPTEVAANGPAVTGRVHFQAPYGNATWVVVVPWGDGGTNANVRIQAGARAGVADFTWTCNAAGDQGMTVNLYAGNQAGNYLTWRHHVRYRCVYLLRINGLVMPERAYVGQQIQGHVISHGGAQWLQLTSRTPGWNSGRLPTNGSIKTEFAIPCPKAGRVSYDLTVVNAQGQSSEARTIDFECVDPTPANAIRIVRVNPPVSTRVDGNTLSCAGGRVTFTDPQNAVGMVRLHTVRVPSNYSTSPFAFAMAGGLQHDNVPGQKYFVLNLYYQPTGFSWVFRAEFLTRGSTQVLHQQYVFFDC